MPGKKIWTEWQMGLAESVYARHVAENSTPSAAYTEIARTLKFSVNAVKSRFYLLGPTFAPGGQPAARSRTVFRRTNAQIAADEGRPATGGLRLSEQQIADRDARAEAADRRTYTQQFFGDPPPGYSARERANR